MVRLETGVNYTETHSIIRIKKVVFEDKQGSGCAPNILPNVITIIP